MCCGRAWAGTLLLASAPGCAAASSELGRRPVAARCGYFACGSAWGPIAGTTAFCLLQAALIIGLLVNRTKRLRGEAEASLIADISSKFVNTPPGEVDSEIMDETLCIHCGSCIRACPGGLITKAEFPVAIEKGWDLCIDCGHCVAIGPTGAMHQRSMAPEDCEPIDIHLIPQGGRLRQYLKMRRFIRGYIQQPVEKDKVLQLLNVARRAPNGANRQVIRWVVVNDPVKVRQAAGMTIDWMEIVKVKNPVLYQEANLETFVAAWDGGTDRIARGAACIIMACAPEDERTAPAGGHHCHRPDSDCGTRARSGGQVYRQHQHGRPKLSAAARVARDPGRRHPAWNLRARLPGATVPPVSHEKNPRCNLALRSP